MEKNQDNNFTMGDSIKMQKAEFLKVLNKLNLDKNSYCIIASGSMLMYGLCEECNDIDIRTTKELFNSLNEKYHTKQ